MAGYIAPLNDVGPNRGFDAGDQFGVGPGGDSPFGNQASFPNTPCTSRKGNRNAKNECMTQIEPIVLQQRWTISNFSTLLKLCPPGNCLRSTVFRESNSSEACWQVCLYPGGKREENANNVSLFLKMSATAPNREVFIKAEYKFLFLDDNDQPVFNNVNIGDFHAKPPKGGHSWGLRNIPRTKVQNCIRSDQSLVILCVIELIPDITRMQCKRIGAHSGPITEMAHVTKAHVENELKMMRSGEQSDVIIRVVSAEDGIADGDSDCVPIHSTTFNVHRYKLISNSEVFMAMLSNPEYEESKSGMITISDFTPPAVSGMLEFMYAGCITTELSIDQYCELMEIAQKYLIEGLLTFCQDQLITRVSLDSVFDILSVAYLYNFGNIIEHCVEMMSCHKSVIMDSRMWNNFKEKNPQIANIVLEAMVKSDVPPVKRCRV